MITRILKLPNHDNVLVGRDIAKLFKLGHVYEIKKYFGEFVITDVGETSLSEHKDDSPNTYSKIDEIACCGESYVTKNDKNKSKPRK